MSYNRAYILALLVVVLNDLYHLQGGTEAKIVAAGLIYFIGNWLWSLMGDPLPGAVKRGLEDFAREYRK